MSVHTEKVYVSDYEYWNVSFEDGKPMSVTRCVVMWSVGKSHAASTTMSARTEKIIKTAERQVWGER